MFENSPVWEYLTSYTQQTNSIERSLWIRYITCKVSASITPLANPVVKYLSSVILSLTRCLLARGLVAASTNLCL
jgi:hypothetical protein